MKESLSKEVKLPNDTFYVMDNVEEGKLNFAYFHLDENPNCTFIAVFKSLDSNEYTIYWWNDKDNYYESKRKIARLIGDAYSYIYYKYGCEDKPKDGSWRHYQCMNCVIPLEWWDIVKQIKR